MSSFDQPNSWPALRRGDRLVLAQWRSGDPVRLMGSIAIFRDTLWWTYKKLWKITMFNGKIHYFDWAIFNCYVSSPEGIWWIYDIWWRISWKYDPWRIRLVLVYIYICAHMTGVSWWDPWHTINIAAPLGSVMGDGNWWKLMEWM